MKLSLVSLMLFLPLMSGAQATLKKIRLPLQDASSSYHNITVNTLVTLSTDTCLSRYKGIPDTYKEAVVKTNTFDNTNFIYQLHKDKKINDSLFRHLEKIYGFDKRDYSEKKVNSEVKILYAIDKSGLPFFVFDTDNDFSFTGEKLYREEELRKTEMIQIHNIDAVVEGKLIRESIFMAIAFDNCNEVLSDPIEQKWHLCALVKHNKVATLSLSDFTTRILVSNDIYYGFRFGRKGARIYITDSVSSKRTDLITPYKVGDTFYSAQSAIKIDSVDEKGAFVDLIITPNKDRKRYGIDEGTFIKPASYPNAFDSTTTNISNYTGKYVFLDFWGTWCVPCKEANPEVRKLREELLNSDRKDSIVFINVAYEDGAPLSLVKEEMDRDYPEWKSIVEYQNRGNGFVNQLHVGAFPTFLLISPEGEIVARKSGKNDFSLFAERIKSLILK